MSLRSHLRAFLQDPKGIAALTPTTGASIRRILSKTPAGEADLVVEFGPGSGVVTRALLERMRPHARLVAIEAHAGLAARLADRVEDPRLTVVHGTAARVREILAERGLGAADCALSGIPFFWLQPAAALEIVTATHAALAAGGSFVSYQMFYLPRRRLRVHLERRFRTVRSQLDLRNFPPQRIYQAIK